MAPSSGAAEPVPPPPPISRQICKPTCLPLSQVPRTYPPQFPPLPKWDTLKLTSQFNVCLCLLGFIKSGFYPSLSECRCFHKLEVKDYLSPGAEVPGWEVAVRELKPWARNQAFLPPQLCWKKTPPKGTTRNHLPEVGGEREIVFLFTNYNELRATVFNGNHVC